MLRIRGFTLIELVAVMLILAVSGIAVFSYLRVGAEIFVDAVGRDQLSAQSRFALERLSRELKGSLPASARELTDDATYQCLEFVPVPSSGLYLSIPRPPNSNAPMDVVTPDPNLFGSRIIVNAFTEGHIYRNGAPGRSLALVDNTVDTPSAGFTRLEFASGDRFTSGSAARRYYSIDDPVSWCLEGENLRRYQGYGRNQNQQPPSALGTGETMATNLTNDVSLPAQLPFTVANATLQRNGLVQLQLRFARSEGTEPLILHHEVHIPNVQ
ncbi:MAG: prepilin-type N-terminal cleavage/methylation domain-containing protein [Idiomarina sp.]